MKLTKRQRLAAVVVAGAAVVGIGTVAWAQTDHTVDTPALAATATTTTPSPSASTPTKPKARPMRPGPVRRALGRAVHGDVVVRQPGGGYATVTFDRGQVTSASGSQITLKRPDGPSVQLTINADTKFRGIASAAAIRLNEPAVVISKGKVATMVVQRAKPATTG